MNTNGQQTGATVTTRQTVDELVAEMDARKAQDEAWQKWVEGGGYGASSAAQPAQSTEAPPPSWDEYALAEAQRLWELPAMPKAQMVACLQVALVDAMRFAQPTELETLAEYLPRLVDAITADVLGVVRRHPDPEGAVRLMASRVKGAIDAALSTEGGDQ